MNKPVRLLALAGSTRRDSFNKKLVRISAVGARKAGAEVTEIDLADLPMPIFDQDFESEEGMPDNAATFKLLLVDHDGFLISTPEYNGSVTAVLKNAIDWASRRTEGEKRSVAFAGKTAVLMAAAPGRLGGVQGLVHVRAILGYLKVLVLPEQRAISSAFKAFDEDGNLREEKDQATIEGLGRRLVEVTAKLRAEP